MLQTEHPSYIRVAEVDDQHQIYLGERPLPTFTDDEVLVRVAAAGVNRGDCVQRIGFYPPPPGASDIMGLEFAGEVIRIGKNVTGIDIGNRIAALVAGGGYAEYASVHASHTLPLPDHMSFTDGAALPEVIFTVWANIFEHGGLQKGETLLIHGGSSGIGTMAIQMAKLYQAKVIITAGSDTKCTACLELGADHAINYKEDDFEKRLAALTDGQGADVVLDMVGGTYIQKNIAAAARHGRIVNISYMDGFKAEIDFLPVMLKNLTLTGSTLRARPVAEKTRLTQKIRQHIWPHLGDRINPVIDKIFPLSEAAEAQTYMESSQHIGKIILDCTK